MPIHVAHYATTLSGDTDKLHIFIHWYMYPHCLCIALLTFSTRYSSKTTTFFAHPCCPLRHFSQRWYRQTTHIHSLVYTCIYIACVLLCWLSIHFTVHNQKKKQKRTFCAHPCFPVRHYSQRWYRQTTHIFFHQYMYLHRLCIALLIFSPLCS